MGDNSDVIPSGGCPVMSNGGENNHQQKHKPRKPFVLQNLLDGSQMTDTLHHKAIDVSRSCRVVSYRIVASRVVFN